MLFVVVPLLVAHAEIFQVERLGVAHLSAYLTPLRVDGTVGKLDEVERILDIAVEAVEGYMNTRLGRVWILELT